MRALIVMGMGALLASCSGSDNANKAPAAGSAGSSPVNAEQDVALLGTEVFDLVDRAMSYRSAHRGRLPRSLRELGIDELTPVTSRTLTVSGNVPTVSVGFRSTGNHTLANCRGTNALLEEAALSGGQFSLICTLVAGGTTTLKAQR